VTVSTVLMWLADLGSSSHGGSNHPINKKWNSFFVPFTLMCIIRLITIISSNFPPSDIKAARIGQTQRPFHTVQLFGAGTGQVKGCAADLLQSVSKQNVLRKSSMDPVIIRPQGVDNVAFVVSPEKVWYA
jgi:hypothetical protein